MHLSATLKCCFSLVNYSCLHIGASDWGGKPHMRCLQISVTLWLGLQWIIENCTYSRLTYCISSKNISGLFMLQLRKTQLIFLFWYTCQSLWKMEKVKVSEPELVPAIHRTIHALKVLTCDDGRRLWALPAAPSPTFTIACSGCGHRAAQCRTRCWCHPVRSFQQALDSVCMVAEMCQGLSAPKTDLEWKIPAPQLGSMECCGTGKPHEDNQKAPVPSMPGLAAPG